MRSRRGARGTFLFWLWLAVIAVGTVREGDAAPGTLGGDTGLPSAVDLAGASRPAGLAGAGDEIAYVWKESPSPAPPFSTWATAAHTIQEAVDAAQPGQTVLVTNGVYTIGGRAVVGTLTNRVALDKPVLVRSSHGPGVTVIRGAPAPEGALDGSGAVRCAYVGPNALLSGFTLMDGHTQSSPQGQGDGGGVWAEASGVVSNCVLTGNAAAFGGGGAYGGTLRDCILSGNAAIWGGGADSATLENCILTGNVASDAGGGAAGGTLSGCSLSGNSAKSGGGVYRALLYQCTLTDNSATESGGGATGATLHNSIVYHNAAPFGPNYSKTTFYASCTTPLPPGDGNIADDPRLASASHLSAGSPCVGSGDARWSRGVDLDGESWLDPPCMGSDQLVPQGATGPLTIEIETPYTTVAVGFALPLTARIAGRLTRSWWDFGDGMSQTNQVAVRHAWTQPGSYQVHLRAVNDSFPAGVKATLEVQVVNAVYYVNQASSKPRLPYTNWGTAARTIQDAIQAGSAAGRLILVTNGWYGSGGAAVQGSLTNRVALTNPVVVRSVNGPAVTVIAGAENESGVGAVRGAYVGSNAVLSGFTLTNGHTRTQSGLAAEHSGGGAWCEVSGLLTNCWLIGNWAAEAGGGSYGGTLIGCRLTGNSATNGGGACRSTLRQCVLADNTAWSKGGGAAYGMLYDCALAGNSARTGGGVYRATLSFCRVADNVATSCGGGVAFGRIDNSTVSSNWCEWYGGGAVGGKVRNSALTENRSSSDGGGVFRSTLYNSTVTGNLAVWRGGGAAWSDLYNCLVYYNQVTQTWPNHLECSFHYSCTSPLPADGVGNFAAPPQLASLTHLSSTSPCIGVGSSLYSTGVDIDREEWREPPCIGADQYVPGSADGPLEAAIGTSSTNAFAGVALTLTAQIQGRGTASEWNLGDGTVLRNQPYVTHAWTTSAIYTVTLRAYNDSHPEGVLATAVLPVKAQPPSDLTVMNLDSAVRLSWAPSPGATLYHLKRSMTNGGPHITVGTLTTTEYLDAGLVNGAVYYYVVSTIGPGGEGWDSSQVVGRPSDPSIYTQPESQEAIAGAKVSFSVAAAGSGLLRYQWTKDGVNLADGDRISGATSATLTIASVLPDDLGSYRCVVSNESRSVSSEAALLTGGQPIILQVLQTGGLEDRPPARWTGLTFDHPRLGPGFAVPFLAEDAPAMADEIHQYNGFAPAQPLPAYLRGQAYLMNADANKEQSFFRLDVDVMETAVVYLLLDNRIGDGLGADPPDLSSAMAWVVAGGFTPRCTGWNRQGNLTLPDEVGLDENADGTGPGQSIDTAYSVYVKGMRPGSFSLFEQNDGPSRRMYGVVIAPAVPPVLGLEPEDVVVEENRPATLSATLSEGSPPFGFQWFFNNAPLSGASQASYTIPVARSFHQGDYFLVVTNYLLAVTSRVARLTVEEDTRPPSLVSARRGFLLTNVTLVFDEPLAAALVTDPSRYEIMNLAEPGSTAGFVSAELQADAQTLLLTALAPITNGANYSLVARGVPDLEGNSLSEQSLALVLEGPSLAAEWTGAESDALTGVVLSGVQAYVAAGAGGLIILDVRDATHPALAGRCPTVGPAVGLAVSGPYAFVAASEAGLQVIDVRDPTRPVRVGGCDVGGTAVGVAVEGGYAYVAATAAGLRVVDVTDPSQPAAVGGCDVGDTAVGVAVEGGYAYVAAAAAGFRVVDVTDPSQPAAVGGCDVGDTAVGVAVEGRYAYVAAAAAGFRVIDVADPTGPVPVGGSATGGQARGVAVADHYLHIADSDLGLKVIDVHHPAQPFEVGSYDLAEGARAVAPSGHVVYVVGGGSRLTVVALSSDPVLTSLPLSQVVSAYGTARFNVGHQGFPPWSYQWFYNSIPIPGATNESLLLPEVQVSQTGDYSVMVGNRFGALPTANATLTVVPVVAWGSNLRRQTSLSAEMSNAVAVASGYDHNLVLKEDGRLVACGAGSYGLTNVPADAVNVAQIACGGEHNLALRPDGRVIAWGRNDSEQATVPAGLEEVVRIAGGGWHSLALQARGTVVAWGRNDAGQTAVPENLAHVKAIAAGAAHSLALGTDGTVMGWGDNSHGQLNVPTALAGVEAIACGADHNLALQKDGGVTAWGRNDHGQTEVPPEASNVVAIAAGGAHSLALRADGTVIAWGDDSYGQASVPLLGNVQAIAAGYSHSLAMVSESLPLPFLVDPSLLGATFQARVFSVHGRIYLLESKDALHSTAWTPLDRILGDGSWRTLTDTNATSAQRFYRLRLE